MLQSANQRSSLYQDKKVYRWLSVILRKVVMDSKKTDTELLSEEKLNDLTAQNILNRAQGDIDAIWNEINQERRLYDAQWQEIFLILLAMLPTTESTILLQKILEDA